VVWEQKSWVSKVTTDKTPTSSDTDAGSCCHLLHNPAVVTTVSWNYEMHYCNTVILHNLFIHETYSRQSLYYPTNTHNVKNVELLKHIKIMEAAPTCFGLQIKLSSGSHSQCLAKITR